jgi:hypothetical protein
MKHAEQNGLYLVHLLSTLDEIHIITGRGMISSSPLGTPPRLVTHFVEIPQSSEEGFFNNVNDERNIETLGIGTFEDIHQCRFSLHLSLPCPHVWGKS